MKRTLFLVAVTIGAAAHAQPAAKIAQEAYVYGYPLVTMEMTRRVMTNAAKPENGRAPMGEFVNMRQYPTAAFRDVTAPNADTLYSSAWLDLSDEPYVLEIPDMQDRYFLFPMLDAWTNVFQVPGKRTTGTHAQRYALTGPGWTGTLPSGVMQIKAPTNMVWILGRIYCSGTPEDYAKVHAIQDQLALVPLRQYGKSYRPPRAKVDADIDMKTPVRDQVNALSGDEFFSMLSTAMAHNPAPKADTAMLAKLKKLGIVPGHEFKPDAAMRDAIAAAPQLGQKQILSHEARAGRAVNGWMITTKTGLYGTNYLQRAFIAWFGLGANRPEDAVYPTSFLSPSGLAYDGANRYVLHFKKGEAPPVNAFWSLTMYDDEMFFVENPLHKHTVSPRNALHYNDDGSLDLYLQHDSPGKEREANWLPAPSGKFKLMLRMYWPKKAVLTGAWSPPPVTKQPPTAATRPTTPPL